MKRLLTIIMLVATVPLSAKDLFYMAELTGTTGFQTMSEPANWTSSKNDLLRNDIFFRDETVFKSTNVSQSFSPAWSSSPVLSLEAMMGVNLDQLPGLDKVRELRGFKGFRAGGGIILYPFSSRDSYNYSGKIKYTDTTPRDSVLAEMPFDGSISMYEDMFIIVNKMNLFYYHEQGFKIGGGRKIVPYGGFELGLGILTGQRKLVMETKPLSVDLADGTTEVHQLDAQAQESAFNSLAFRFGTIAGAQMHLDGPHFLDLRLGFILQEHTVTVQRGGTFNHTIKDRSGNVLGNYSRAIAGEKDLDFSLTGFYVSLGYTVGIL